MIKQQKALAFLFCYWCLWTPFAYAQTTAEYFEELWLSAKVNQLTQEDTLFFLRQADGKVWVSAKDWQQWRLKPPTVSVISYQDEVYYCLDLIQGVQYHINPQQLTIQLTVSVNLFESTQIDASSSKIDVTDLATNKGFFLNYELSSAYQEDALSVGMLNQFVAFSQWGVLESDMLTIQSDGFGMQQTRLNTRIVKDYPQKLTTLSLGDSITTSMNLGSARFAGVKWATNSSLQPTLVRSPVFAIQGVAKIPSTVDVFINNLRTISQQVPTGAFSIDNIPVLSGRGEVRMVVKDALGQEQEIVQPYYTDAELLQTGLSEYAFDIGFVRENFGITSNDYGQLLAIASHRLGITSYLTTELHTQFLQHQQTIQYGAVYVLPSWGTIQVGLANSWHTNDKVGQAWYVTTGYQSTGWAVSLQGQGRSHYFTSLDRFDTQAHLKSRQQILASKTLVQGSSISVSYIAQQDYQQPDTSMVQLAYNRKLWGGVFNVLVNKMLKQQTEGRISFVLPLTGKHTVALNTQPTEKLYQLNVQRSMPTGNGIGYQFSFEDNQQIKQQYYAASLNAQHNRGKYQVQLSDKADTTALNMQIRGAIVGLNKKLFLSHPIDGSFAVVNVGGYANVDVYLQNQRVATTNKHGQVLVTGLQPYEINKISINTSGLPFDAQVGNDMMSIIPTYRSGSVLDFPIKRSYGATLTLLLDNGNVVPAGMLVHQKGSAENFPVGFNGELYLTGLKAKNILIGEWKGQFCQIELAFVSTDDGLPDLGTHICRGISP